MNIFFLQLIIEIVSNKKDGERENWEGRQGLSNKVTFDQGPD